MSENNGEEQGDEILALSEILPSGSFQWEKLATSSHTGSIQVCASLSCPVVVVDTDKNIKFSVSHLPPITINFRLSENYPSTSAPEFSLSCKWLSPSQLTKAEEQLTQIWRETVGNVVLFLWVNFLQEDLLPSLKFTYKIDLLDLLQQTIEWNKRVAGIIEGECSTSRGQAASPEVPLLSDQRGAVDACSAAPAAQSVAGPAGSSAQYAASSAGDAEYVACAAAGHVGATGHKTEVAEDTTDRALVSAKRYKGKVKSYSVEQGRGVIYSLEVGSVLVEDASITSPDLSRLEVSLETGEYVEFSVRESSGGTNSQFQYEAFDLTGVSGGVVVGSRRSEAVHLIWENVLGRVHSWNKQKREGKIKILESNEMIYVYFTALHFSPKNLHKNKTVRLNVVECKRWGVLAQFVRLVHPPPDPLSPTKWTMVSARDSPETGNKGEVTPTEEDFAASGTSAHSYGRIKKWKKGSVYIVDDAGREWRCRTTDCKSDPRDLFKGVSVKFLHYKAAGRERAGAVCQVEVINCDSTKRPDKKTQADAILSKLFLSHPSDAIDPDFDEPEDKSFIQNLRSTELTDPCYPAAEGETDAADTAQTTGKSTAVECVTESASAQMGNDSPTVTGPTATGENPSGKTPTAAGKNTSGNTPTTAARENPSGSTTPTAAGENPSGNTPTTAAGENPSGSTTPRPPGENPSGNTPPVGAKSLYGSHQQSPTQSKKEPNSRISSLVKNLSTILREYNNMKEEENFATSLFCCQVCFSEKQGLNCIKFTDCHHVYCSECMGQFFRVQIEAGQMSSLTCPETGCSSQALPSQVQAVVSEDLFRRYESILLETTLEAMVDVVLCPRIKCQCPTVIDRDNNMGQCPSCQLTFCIYCKATYHGVSPCKFKTQEHRAILDKYSKGTEQEKLFLEKRYGKRELQLLLTQLLSEDYLTQNAKHCPHCNAPIEKNDGCNKINCKRCNTNFCWLCGDKLPATNPYSHFNITGGNCYGALFQGMEDSGDEFEDDDEWEGFL